VNSSKMMGEILIILSTVAIAGMFYNFYFNKKDESLPLLQH